MCDSVRMKKSACHPNAGKRIGPVKLSKWELPIPQSKSYWDGICAEIEKKHKRVRDAYPSTLSILSSVAPPASDHTQSHDDFKFKISPPTPMHKMQNSIASKPHRDVVPTRDHVDVMISHKERLKHRRAVEFDKSINRPKVFSRNSCPLHLKNASASVRIFDDDISRYLTKSVPTLPSIVEDKRAICERHRISRSKSMLATSATTKETRKPVAAALQKRSPSKAPKLGTASLLPSFARPVSTDSSAGTRSSFESEEEQLSKVAQSQADATTTTNYATKDYLRLPNLSFVSSHPSFRKLSLVDSVDDQEGILSFAAKTGELPERQTSLPRDNSVSASTDERIRDNAKDTKSKEKAAKSMYDLEKEYAYKALDVLTRKKHAKLRGKFVDCSSEKSSMLSEVSSIPHAAKLNKLMRSLDKESSIDFREVGKKLKCLTSGSCVQKSVSIDPDKTELKTIYSASRGTSSSSPDFESRAIEIPTSAALENIPETKIFQRAYVDKCHACLLKPVKSESKVTRELPLATLLSIIKNPPEFRLPISSSSSSSSSSSISITEEIRVPLIDDYENDDNPYFTELKRNDFSEDTCKNKEQDHPRVSFDRSNLTAVETRDKSQSASKLQSEHHLKEKSSSIQSSDRSKTSTPSNQSSDSDDTRALQDADKLPSSKFMAPCHAPVVLRKSLEPLRALRQKKFMSLRARAAAITAKSSDGSHSDSQHEDIATSKPEEIVGEGKQEVKKKEKKKKKKKKKKAKLKKIKSAAEGMTEFSASMDARDVKDKKLLKRAKTTFDLLDDESSGSRSKESSEDDEVSVEAKENDVEKKEEELPLADAIAMHRAGSPPSPIMSSHDVVDIVKACLQDHFSPANLLDRLDREFARRMNERYERLKNNEDAKYIKLGLDLYNALIDSRRYLKPDIFAPDLQFSHKQVPLANSRQLRRILPPESYELVAPILGMPKSAESIEIKDDKLNSKSTQSEISFDMIVHPPTFRDPEHKSDEKQEPNPYALFLKKSRRKAVVWRPLREEDMKGYDPEATLEMRATRLMNRICNEFCDWVRQLGGNEQVIDEETLKDMFEINFTSEACKSTMVVIREMPTVPNPVVKIRHCPEANELEATRKQMREDVKVEARPKRTFAFGRSLPRGFRFVPPRTSIASKWLDCEYIPKDLENMDVVWDDIGHLDSVQEFYNFLRSKTVTRSSKLLKNLGEAVKAKKEF